VKKAGILTLKTVSRSNENDMFLKLVFQRKEAQGVF